MRVEFIAAVGLVALVSGCGVQAPTGPSSVPPSSSAATVHCDYTPGGQASRTVELPSADASVTGAAVQTLEFPDGLVKITMDRQHAPCTVNSFESLAKQGYFDNTKCHRLADNGLFMLQCGDPSGTGMGGPGYTFADELGLAKKFYEGPSGKAVMYPKGTVAMANAGPNTNGSQFFLLYVDSELPPAYTAFGVLDETGIATIADIAAASHDGSHGDGTGKPNKDATIKSVVAG